MKVSPSPPQGVPVVYAREFLNPADTTVIRPSRNNAQTSAGRAVEFLHAKSFPSCAGNSLIEFKRNPDAVSRPFTRLKGEISEVGQYLSTITDKNYSTLLRPSVNGYLPDLHVCNAKGRPSPGPVQRLPMVGFCLPNEKESGMSQQEPPMFLPSS